MEKENKTVTEVVRVTYNKNFEFTCASIIRFFVNISSFVIRQMHVSQRKSKNILDFIVIN